tara:strand:- start:3185 stop:5083 length:1899 start_codon:yes stop_codon:yes gene_type:complete
MSGQVVAQMKQLNEQFEAFIKLQTEAKQEAVKAAEAAEKALKKETATIKALNLTYNKKGKLVRNGKVLVNEFGQEVNRVGEVVSNFNKRTTVLTKAIEDLNNQGKSFEIFSKTTRKAYMDAGGNIFEFLAEAIAGTREEITIFGQEGAKIRKIMYGFFPPGTFRALNRASSVLQAIGSATRRAQRSTADYQADIEKLKEAQKGLAEDDEDFINLQKSIDKMREDMRQSGGNIIGTTVKALGKIPRLGKFTKGLEESRAVIERGQTRRIQLETPFGDIEQAKQEQQRLLRLRGSQFGAGAGFRTAAEESNLELLNDILNYSELGDAVVQGFINSPIVAIFDGIESFVKKSGLFLRKVFSKDFGKKVMSFVGMAMKFMFSVMIYATLFFTLLYFFRRPISNALSAIGKLVKEQLPAFKESMMSSFRLIKSSFMDIYNGFKDGDLLQVFEGIWGVAWGVLSAAFKVLLAVGTVALVGLGAFIGDFFLRILEWLGQTWTAFWNGEWKTVLKKIGVAVAVLTVLFVGWPALIATAIIGGVVALINFVRNRFFADGGITPAGLTVVGERGPELVNLPAGSRVHSNRDSAKMMGGSVVNNFNITVNAKDTSKAEMRRIADEIGKQINQKMNRKRGANVV